MKDTQLRELELLAQTDPQARFDYRRLLVRIGQPEKAGFEVGDIVLVQESAGPWICGEWEGILTRLLGYDRKDKYVRPLSKTPNWRNPNHQTNMDPNYLQKGLFLTRFDLITLIEPYNPLEQRK